jgi:small nuclear ribonucleoprotein B and B'
MSAILFSFLHLLHYVLHRRVLVGVFMAFDRHMNIVLGETQEFRRVRTKKVAGLAEEREEKRALGLVILRGDCVVSMTIEGPPPVDSDERAAIGGPGQVKAAPRGPPVPALGAAPIGLAGPVRGVGGPGIGLMQPPAQGNYKN